MHDRIIGLYEDNAAEWDRIRGRRLMERAWLDRFLSPIPANGAILDIGCGAGEPIAGYLIGAGRAVTGVDSAPSLIAMAGDRFPDHTWIATDMRALDLGRRFHGLIAWHSLFHLSPDDQRPMFARFAAHAAPGAMLMFTSGSEWGETIGEWMGAPLYHASLGTDEYRALLEENGFGIVDHKTDDPECGGATIWLAQRKGAD